MKKDLKSSLMMLMLFFLSMFCIGIVGLLFLNIVEERQNVPQIVVKEQRITIYNIQGELQREYRGKFSVEYDGEYITFTSEEGLSHTIYSPMEMVIIDDLEVKKEIIE